MTLSQLKSRIRAGAIDTVITAFPDPFGRLVGKRFHAPFFLDHVLNHGTHGCNYLLTVSLDMDPLDGFDVASWDKGFGDFAFRPDPGTIRELPWQPATALVLCDYTLPEGQPVPETPRAVLQRQVAQLTQLGFTAAIASELEFYLFNQSYPAAFATDYRTLEPSSDYRIDYHILQPTRDEPLMRAIRTGMTAAGIPIESSKGEWSRGQHEINLTYSDPVEMADRHVLFKHGVKELAQQHQKSVSFMAKYAPGEAGSSCHIHISLWQNGHNAFAPDSNDPSPRPASTRRRPHSPKTSATKSPSGSPLFRHFLAGLLKYSPQLCLFFAPTVNSYKRYQPGSWAPTRMAWSGDNRTVGFRVVGHAESFRIENRMPGADANPYLAFAAMIAAGLAGVRENLEPGPAYPGNAYIDTKLPRLPATLHDATRLFQESTLARKAFGDAVVHYYVRHARIEQQAFNDAVTDWEKRRYFERI